MEQLADVISKNKVTHTLLLPSLYQLLLKHGSLEKLSSLTTVAVAGEACPGSLCQLHFDKMPATRLYNEYGPTEATVWCIAHKITPEDAAGPVPIGRPIANTQAFILDKKFQPVPVGVPGELYIGGAGVTEGYWNRPDLTADRFVKFPAHSSPLTPHSSPLYKTGDLARYRPDGLIEFLGRADRQVKIRGYRIELDEIRDVLQKHPSVKEAVVVVRNEGKEVDETERLAMILGEMEESEALQLLDAVSSWTDAPRNTNTQIHKHPNTHP
jgi:non-ribosomal peptide synthetase component F